MRRAGGWLWVAMALISSACGPGGGGQATPIATAGPSPIVAPLASAVASAVPGPNLSPDQQQAVAAAVQDAATRLGVAAGDIGVQQVEEREWGDSSLGCPQPGLLYSQVVTPGFLIVINSRGKQLEYHSDMRGRVVLCRES
jgi:hypothetical protein